MNIITLKHKLFTDLKRPLAFLEEGRFRSTGIPTKTKRFGSTVYFYDGEQEWCEKTPECHVAASNVNTFAGEQHKLVLTCPDAWATRTSEKLRAAAQLAFDAGHVQVPEGCKTFDTFWNQCRVPKFLSIESEAYARRGRRKIYVPVFAGKKEVTGVHNPKAGASVQIMVRWTLCQSMDGDRLHTGFRPLFSGGLCIEALGGAPPPIRRPWSWLDVDFDSLSVPMYNSLSVKAPCVTVLSVDENNVRVAPTPTFEAVMKDFHASASADPWCHDITLPYPHNACAGSRLMATIVPCQNSTGIEWVAVKHRVLPPPVAAAVAAVAVAAEAVAEAESTQSCVEKVGAKRRVGNTGNSCGEKTKRQCISDGIDAHKTV